MRGFGLHNGKKLVRAELQGILYDSIRLDSNRAFNNRGNYYILI
jgi:hypothetical protein